MISTNPFNFPPPPSESQSATIFAQTVHKLYTMQLILPTFALAVGGFAQDMRLPTIKFPAAGVTSCRFAYGGLGVADRCYETRFVGKGGAESQYASVQLTFPTTLDGTACAGRSSLIQLLRTHSKKLIRAALVIPWTESNCTGVANLAITETVCENISQVRSFKLECPQPATN
jgi:hypothetical protein